MSTVNGSAARLALGLALCCIWPGASQAGQPLIAQGPAPQIASSEVTRIADWVRATGDTGGRPFLIIDKIQARAFAFDSEGKSSGSAPVLLGLAKGDVSPPGIGNRKLADITAAERITPSGRFEAGFGLNPAGKDILWVDYDAAISLHRVVTSNAAEHRLRRLATETISDNRISYGCINVPVAFYDQIVRPLFQPNSGVVYITPEVLALTDVFAVPKR